MNMKWTLVLALMLAPICWAADLEELCKDGYGVYLKTNVSGEFKGCEYDRQIPLDNGLIFKCSGYSYHYAYRPNFYVLNNVKDNTIKYVIDNEEFSGGLYR